MDLILKGKKRRKAIGEDKPWVLASFLIPCSLYISDIFVFLSGLVSLFVHPKESCCDKDCADIRESRVKERRRDRKGKLRDRLEVELSFLSSHGSLFCFPYADSKLQFKLPFREHI